MVYNEDGEPLYIDNVYDAYEQEEAEWEERMHCADDPMYAAQKENEMWLAKAYACFEEQGITVPYSVVEILADEMRKKQMKLEEEREIAKVQPLVDFINKKIPDCGCYAMYVAPTPAEYGYVELHYKKEPYREDMEAIMDEAFNKNLPIDDYVSLHWLNYKNK
jgi:hypothetical protein